MSESAVVRAFETRAIRPLWLVTIAATLAAGFASHWWSVLAGVVALFGFGMIGASLHPMQSFKDLSDGPLEGRVARIEQRITPDNTQRLLVSRACTYLTALLAAMLVWIGFALLHWRWFAVLPSSYATAGISGSILRYRFVLARRPYPSSLDPSA